MMAIIFRREIQWRTRAIFHPPQVCVAAGLFYLVAGRATLGVRRCAPASHGV